MARGEQLDILALCSLDGVTGAQWQVIARQADSPTGLRALLDGVVSERSAIASALRSNLEKGLPALDQQRVEVAAATRRAEDEGAQLVTVLDDSYPVNLRRVHDLPPFLYVLGDLTEDDIRSLAVVGTRSASSRGLAQAGKLARLLVDEGVTVVSGMAAGIDTAAHEATLDAGGRTVAVMGTGILRCYPKDNEDLKRRIAEHGAVLSQFWPDQPPGRHTFPMRNVVTSGVSQGTAVIEASVTSGAKMQARLAYEHGKQVFVIQSLVTDQKWAEDFVAQGKAVEVHGVGDVMAHLRDPAEVREAVQMREQLALEFA